MPDVLREITLAVIQYVLPPIITGLFDRCTVRQVRDARKRRKK